MVCEMRIEAHANEDETYLWFSGELNGRWEWREWDLGTWQKLKNLCLPFLPEHIEWDSVTRLVITYSEFQGTPGTWSIIIVTTDGLKGDGIPGHLPNTEIEERIPIGREQEDEFRTQIHDFLTAGRFLGLQILEPIFPTGQ